MTLRVLAVGMTQSGKTEWLWRRYLRHSPRVLIVDTIGEWGLKVNRGELSAVPVSGVEETLAAMRALAYEPRWTIVADLDREEVAMIGNILVPRRIADSPVPGLGGIAIYLDEVDILIPQGDSRLAGLFRRGRHVSLSVFAATQRPASVNKEVSAMVDVYGVLRLSEVRDIQYLRQRFGRSVADRGLAWSQSAPYRVALFAGGELFLMPPEHDGPPQPDAARIWAEPATQLDLDGDGEEPDPGQY